METHGGGWTLVYSYTFTNYSSFDSDSNAVTPRPNWPTLETNVSISTTPPLSESSLGALDWTLWKHVGQEFMVKSTINDWILCQQNHGSIVTKQSGSISCENIKNVHVATTCAGLVLNRITWFSHAPIFFASKAYHSFDGARATHPHWPRHDPRGEGEANHKKAVSNPGGQIYLR